MNKFIIVDSREKPRAIGRILGYFESHGIRYDVSKLRAGDYMDYNNPSLIIDRKQDIGELAKNCTYINKKKGIDEPARFRRELERVAEVGAHLVILVEQNRYKDRGEWVRVREIVDLIRWSSPHSMVRGEKVYRVLARWTRIYPLTVVFCDKRSTGREIVNILYKGNLEPSGGE